MEFWECRWNRNEKVEGSVEAHEVDDWFDYGILCISYKTNSNIGHNLFSNI